MLLFIAVRIFHVLGPKLEQMMTELRQELTNQPPLAGAYNPKRGDLCAARFSQDNQWYRARVELVKGREQVEILYVDFGNVRFILDL